MAEQYLTIPEVVAELRVPRSTVRIRRCDLDDWVRGLEGGAA